MDHDLALQGIYLPTITPFTDAGELAADALEKLAHTAIDDGASGLVALGTTAEAAALTPEEKHTVIDTCSRVCQQRAATLVVGVGSNDTRSTAAALDDLRQWPDVAAALVTVPYFTRPSEAGVIAHFAQLASQSPVPLIIYNIPYRTARSLSAETLRALADIPGVAGVKHATGGIDQDTVDFLSDPPSRFAVLGGDDAFASPLLALGASGGILASAHVRTRDFVHMVQAWQAGNALRARDLGNSLAPLSRALFAEPNPAVIKGVLHAQGRIPSPAVRLPLLPAQPESVAAALAHSEA